jgi:hypothetical protein
VDYGNRSDTMRRSHDLSDNFTPYQLNNYIVEEYLDIYENYIKEYIKEYLNNYIYNYIEEYLDIYDNYILEYEEEEDEEEEDEEEEDDCFDEGEESPWPETLED